MKLTDKTISTLKAFSGINPNIMISEGNVLKTISTQKLVFAQATVDQEFPCEVGIYDLGKLLGTISLFDSAEVDFTPELITIGSGKNKVVYRTATANSLTLPPAKPINFVPSDIAFELTQSVLNLVLKVAAQLGVQDISVQGADGKLSIVARDLSNQSSSDEYSVELGEANGTFRYDFKVENFKFIAHDYDVQVSEKKIAKLTSKDGSVNYFVAAQHSSQV